MAAKPKGIPGLSFRVTVRPDHMVLQPHGFSWNQAFTCEEEKKHGESARRKRIDALLAVAMLDVARACRRSGLEPCGATLEVAPLIFNRPVENVNDIEIRLGPEMAREWWDEMPETGLAPMLTALRDMVRRVTQPSVRKR